MDPLTMFTPKEFVEPEPCTIYDMYNDIQFKMTKLFIDTRTPKAYNKQHIRSAVNIPLNTFDLYRLDSNLLETKIDAFITKKLYSISKIIWYGNHTFNTNDARQHLFYQRSTDLIMSKIRMKNKGKIDLNALNNSTKQKKDPPMYILNCKYNIFESKYPFLCDNKPAAINPNSDPSSLKQQMLMDFVSMYMMNKKMKLKDSIKVYPSCIIDDQFFLGNAAHCSDDTILKNLGITHIINCTQTLNNEFERPVTPKYISPSPVLNTNISDMSLLSINTSPSYSNVTEEIKDEDEYIAEYIRVPVNDIADQKIKKYFIDAIKFIQTTLNANINSVQNRILCHCHAGISRSSTITICYLMFSENLTFIEALKLVQSKRDIVNPNQGFRVQIVEFERFLNAKRILLNKNKLSIDDLYDFNDITMEEINRNKSESLSLYSDKNEEDMVFLQYELKKCFQEYFFSLIYDDVYYFLDKYGSMIINQFPQLFGILIEDILLNENNCNCQLFILLMVDLFKNKQISNLNNNFVNDALCGFVAKGFHDNLIDCPYFLQFIGALFAHLFNAG
eukprot:180401_1